MKQWLAQVRRRMGRFRSDSDLEDELRGHLEMQTEDNAATGIPPSEALRRAQLQLGRSHAIVERVRDQDLVTMLESCYRDLLLGLRAIRKSPVFCLTAILTLAFGIGANTAIFALLYGLLLRSLPVTAPQQLVYFRMVSAGSNDRNAIPYQMLLQLKQQQHSFADISAWAGYSVTMPDGEGNLRAYSALLASGNAFSLLGLKPYLGRLIAPGDDIRGGPSEGWPVVLSFGLWSEHFGADSQIVGKQIKISNIPATVIGVTPPAFRGIAPGADYKMYFPLQFLVALTGRDELNTPASFTWCAGIGRLKPGASIAQAEAEMAFYRDALFHQFIPLRYQHQSFFEKARLTVESARTGLPTYFGRVYAQPLWIMQGLVAVVLLLCCVNVGGLLMSKVYARQREFAVRTAIGAARWRLIRQYLTESFIIALIGAALGAVVAWYGSLAVLSFFRDPMMGQPIAVEPDRMVFWVTGLCAVGTTLLFGTLPAWRAGRSDPAVLLNSRTTAAARRQIAGRAFVPVQVALSLVLVAVATLLSQSLVRIRTERTGFDLNHVTIQTPNGSLVPYRGEASLNFYQRLVDRLEQMPGIRSVAVTMHTPMTGFDSRGRFQAMTQGPNPAEDSHMAYNAVGPGYFRTMETHILEGREFEKQEREPNICILNRSAANYLFPHEPAIDHYVRGENLKDFRGAGPFSCRVIGIAEDAKFASLREAPPRTIYFPVSIKTQATGLVFLINSATKAQAIAGYRKALSEIAPAIPLSLFATLRDQMDAALGSQRLLTLMTNLFAGLALFLGAIGLYGLLSSAVAQRTGEIGVRIALGASRGNVVGMILSEAAVLVGAGVLLGGAALFFAVRFIQNMLFGVSPFDPITLAATTILLMVTAMLAAGPPALRAASVDPVDALRAE